MSGSISISHSDAAKDLLQLIRATPSAIASAIRYQNALTVSHIQKRYLSFPSGGPSTPEGLRVQTGSLRRAIVSTPPVIEGNRVSTTIGGFVNVKRKGASGKVSFLKKLLTTPKSPSSALVNYLAVHEFGATIPGRGKGSGFTLPARGMIQKGIKGTLPDYSAQIVRFVKKARNSR